MDRRSFLRMVGWAVVAVLAGVPLAKAWHDAIERQRRQARILAQMEYQARQSMARQMRLWAEETYGRSNRDDYRWIDPKHGEYDDWNYGLIDVLQTTSLRV